MNRAKIVTLSPKLHFSTTKLRFPAHAPLQITTFTGAHRTFFWLVSPKIGRRALSTSGKNGGLESVHFRFSFSTFSDSRTELWLNFACMFQISRRNLVNDWFCNDNKSFSSRDLDWLLFSYLGTSVQMTSKVYMLFVLTMCKNDWILYSGEEGWTLYSGGFFFSFFCSTQNQLSQIIIEEIWVMHHFKAFPVIIWT